MEEALDEDTQAALDGIVGKYAFSEKDLKTFAELVGRSRLPCRFLCMPSLLSVASLIGYSGCAQVDNMRGTAWGLLAATGITVVLSFTKEVTGPSNILN